MNRYLLVVAAICATFAGDLCGAVVRGNVSFQTRRGQRPVVTETLVWLEPLGAKPPRRAPVNLTVTTRGKTILPHVVAIPVGSTITFPNEDPISHNLFSLTPTNTFDLGLYRQGPGKSRRFDAAGIVNLYCNVHPNMSAVIHVMTTPYYAFADAAGGYSFDVPPGKYRLVAWNEQGGTSTSEVDVTASGVSGNVALMIDGRNYRVAQHTNKEGKPYQAPSSRDY